MTGTAARRSPGPRAAAHGAVTPALRRAEDGIARLAEDAARRTPGVSAPAATAQVDGAAARVDLDVVVDLGVHLPTAAEGVRRRVATGIRAHTGHTVEAVTVTVVDLRLPDGTPAAPATRRRAGG